MKHREKVNRNPGRPAVLKGCKKYKFNIKTSDYNWLKKIGDDNASLGLRRYLEVKDKFEKRNY